MVCYDCLFNGSIVGILLLLPIDRVPHKKWFAALTRRAAAAKNEMNVRMCTWSTLYVENNTHTMPLWNTVFAVAWMCKWNVERKKSAWNVHHAIHCHTAQNTIFHSMQMCLCLYVCVKDANRTTSNRTNHFPKLILNIIEMRKFIRRQSIVEFILFLSILCHRCWCMLKIDFHAYYFAVMAIFRSFSRCQRGWGTLLRCRKASSSHITFSINLLTKKRELKFYTTWLCAVCVCCERFAIDFRFPGLLVCNDFVAALIMVWE